MCASYSSRVVQTSLDLSPLFPSFKVCCRNAAAILSFKGKAKRAQLQVMARPSCPSLTGYFQYLTLILQRAKRDRLAAASRKSISYFNQAARLNASRAA
jgi:hypothetical protein